MPKLFCPRCGSQIVDLARWKRIDEARKRGVSWESIAERFGYKDRKSACVSFLICGRKALEDAAANDAWDAMWTSKPSFLDEFKP